MAYTVLNLASCAGANGCSSLVTIGDVVNGRRVFDTPARLPITYSRSNGLSMLTPTPDKSTFRRIRCPLLVVDTTKNKVIELLLKTTPMFVSYTDGVGSRGDANPYIWLGDVNDYLTDVGRIGPGWMLSFHQSGTPADLDHVNGGSWGGGRQIQCPSIVDTSLYVRFRVDFTAKKAFVKVWKSNQSEPTGWGAENTSVDIFTKKNVFLALETERTNQFAGGRARWAAVSIDGTTVPVLSKGFDSFVSGSVLNSDNTPAQNTPVSITDQITGAVLGRAITSPAGSFRATLYGTPVGYKVSVVASDPKRVQQSATIANVATVGDPALATMASHYSPLKP